MVFNSSNLENQLLETTAGRAVYDSLVQANVNLKTVSIEQVKQMLVAECKYLRMTDTSQVPRLSVVC